jgi:hypothetical protein
VNISVSCIDTLNYEKSLHAIKRTIETLQPKAFVSRVYWYSDKEIGSNIMGVPVTHCVIPPMSGQLDYSHVCLKVVPEVCTQDFDIIVQYDGYAVNPDAWTDEFYNYDYIGATWDDGVVGNGGFSWRSRKLYDAMINEDIKIRYDDFLPEVIDKPFHYSIDGGGKRFLPEDVVLCRIYKNTFENNHNVKYAPTHISDRFSIENHSHIAPWTGKPNEWVGKSLGFHGKYGILSLYNL